MNTHDDTTNVTPESPRPTESARQSKPGLRTGPIVWGCLVLLFCAYVAQRTFAPGTIPQEFWLIGSLLGLGALLLGVGIAIVARNWRESQK